MADETKLKEVGEGGQETGKDKDGKADERSEKRFTDLTEKLKNQDEQYKKELQARDERIANLEFDNAFKGVESQYPAAKELKDKIRERVKAGLPVDEAAVVVLHSEGKLDTGEKIAHENEAMRSMGGSADTMAPLGSKRVSDMTPDELRAALLEEERKGTFRYEPD
ncbi:MAG: hypothetical protein KGJ90_04735 [Patescibacteria group bacterium]|nr:hypothetical protein [Patescibacteria group bacterium]